MKEVSERMGKINELMVVFVSGVWGKEVLAQSLNTETSVLSVFGAIILHPTYSRRAIVTLSGA